MRWNMVNVTDIYLVMRTVAILHELPETKNIDLKNFEKIMSPPVTAAATPSGTMISSQRDQIEILIAGNKTDFRDLSGKTDFTESKIEGVAQYFAGEFKLKANTMGINFIIRVPQEDPEQWMIDNIISSEFSKKTKKKLIGGSASVSIKSGSKTWNIVFEISEKNKIGLNFNMTKSTKQILDAQKIKKEFEDQWKFLVRLLNELGL
jgi:hypothetical protein